MPINGYTQLEQQIDAAEKDKQLKSLVFLNCGASNDLTQRWFSESDSNVDVYVFDSHRPIAHTNIISDKKVFLIDDGKSNLKDCPVEKDFDF